MTTIIGRDEIKLARMLTLRSALKLEILGMKRRGRSVYSIIKQEFGITGNKKHVLEQFNLIIEKEKYRGRSN